MCKILVVAPHPDDAEFGVGGTIVKRIKDGGVATIAVVTAGNLVMVHSGATISFDQRKDEQTKAAKVLGVTDVRFLGLGEPGSLGNQPGMKLVSGMDTLFAEGWDEIYIPLPSYNQDHVTTWRTCIAATRPGKVDKALILAYENPFQGHGEQVFGTLVSKWYEKIDPEQLGLKIQALSQHGSQINGRSDSLSGVAGVKALAHMRGLECGAMYAEMFYPVRIVR